MYLLNGTCAESCLAGMTSLGIGSFKRRCLAPFECENGRIVGADVSYGCKCANDDMTPSACQFCSFRANEFGTHCTRCLGGQFLQADNRCHDTCEGLDGMIAYAPGTRGRECREAFTCTDRVDQRGHACACSRSVGRHDCSVCEYGGPGGTCARCTNHKVLRDGACVESCGDGEVVIGAGADGLECG